MRPLTPRQREVLNQIKLHLDQTGFPPTRAEIAGALGFRSVNAAEDHLKALARKGMLELCAGTSRGIRLLPVAEAELARSASLASGGAAEIGPAASTGKFTALDVRSTDAARAGAGGQSAGHRLGPRATPLPAAGAPSSGQGLSLPLVGRVAAGRPILAEHHIESSFTIDPGLFERRPDYLLRIRGESMRDAGMLDGDLLAVKVTPEAHNGQIVVARLGNDVTVKRFRHARTHIELLPANPAFEPIIVAADSTDFHIEGIGVGLIRQQTGWH